MHFVSLLFADQNEGPSQQNKFVNNKVMEKAEEINNNIPGESCRLHFPNQTTQQKEERK